MSSFCIWFWQRIISPHMAELALELSLQGCDVAYIAEEPMSADRAQQGWTAPRLHQVRQEFATTTAQVLALVESAPKDSIHICQGIRSNGLVGFAQRALKERGLRQWVVMETVDDSGWRGIIKRIEYQRLFGCWNKCLQGVLATGHSTPEWVSKRGVLNVRVFPFAYFLKDIDTQCVSNPTNHSLFRFLFVGQLIERKRVGLLLDALQQVDPQQFEVSVVGSGPLELSLKAQGEKILPGRINWIGRLPLDSVQKEMVQADCLVLPSRHDGWGAVVSEALMVGTPVICSDACGSQGVVRCSGYGAVFFNGDCKNLTLHMERILRRGVVKNSERVALANWAKCLGAKAGASYLIDILQYDNGSGARPCPPWCNKC